MGLTVTRSTERQGLMTRCSSASRAPDVTSGFAQVSNARVICSLALFRGGFRNVTCCNDEAATQVFDARMMRKLATLRGHQADVTCAAWHPWHEDLFVSGSHDGAILHWLVSHPAEPQAGFQSPYFPLCCASIPDAHSTFCAVRKGYGDKGRSLIRDVHVLAGGDQGSPRVCNAQPGLASSRAPAGVWWAGADRSAVLCKCMNHHRRSTARCLLYPSH